MIFKASALKHFKCYIISVDCYSHVRTIGINNYDTSVYLRWTDGDNALLIFLHH